MKNEAKFVGGCSELLFELGISLNDPVRARKFSKPKKSRDFNFCKTELTQLKYSRSLISNPYINLSLP